MSFREHPEEKQMRLILTRGEVDSFLRKHLRETGKIPEDAKIIERSMAVLHAEGNPSGRDWEDFPAYSITWTEPA